MRALLIAVLLVAAPMSMSACATSQDPSAASASATVEEYDKKLHDELVGMLERDQRERTGGPLGEGDEARTERLKEILAKHGWPTFDLVGKDGEDAAWAIAQHSDHDPAFQRRALALLRDAVADGEASPGNLAYLADRVAVGRGEPQEYGTQISCGRGGPVPSTPIKDRAHVDERRAAAGLDPLADYLAEMTKICALD